MENRYEWIPELIDICKILKENGINIEDIQTKGTRDGERYFRELKDIKIEGINIEEIIKQNGLDENFEIGKNIYKMRHLYVEQSGNLTDEQIKIGEELGILKKRNKTILPPLFKGRKISQFHVRVINKHLDRILSGELNTREALELLKQESIEANETIIKDPESIKRIVEMILKDRPEELEEYRKVLKNNLGNRNLLKGRIGIQKIGTYHEEEKKFKSKIIEEYLPKILKGEITIETIEEELSTSHKTIKNIIEEYYKQNGDEEGLQDYYRARQTSKGASIERRKRASEMRDEIAKYEIVSGAEFLLLTPEKQLEQVMMKIRRDKLKEEKLKEEKSGVSITAVMTEESTQKRVEMVMEYFKGKNDSKNGEIYFSDQDIRYMIFRYPTLISRNAETLDEKIETLTSYEGIDKETAYGMIKTFPTVMGYDASRTKKQLDLLEKEGLMDYAISKPDCLMRSVNLIYALIEYAKERHHTSDLSEVTRSNIFMTNNALKRIYNVSFDELKEKYPYSDREEENDVEYTISAEDIGKATYTARGKSDEASQVLRSITKDKSKGGQE